jgi:RNA polymerase sigma-70 factor (ECF subfamily)
MPTLASRESEMLVQFSQGTTARRQDAFEILFREHQREVYGWILRIVRNQATAEELTVETFWRIYRAHARFNPRRGFAAWARRIATHAAIDWLRAQRAQVAANALELPPDLPAPPENDSVITAELRCKTAQAFARLKPGLRVAATLAVIEERPHKEIAEALGISVAAVKVRVFRALRQLRKHLQNEGITP